MARRTRAATITQVAAHAGVSPATVSRVMNGRFVGDEAVAERVRASAAALDYSASPLARSLALGVTRTIALVVPDLANPAFQAVLSGLSKGASRDGYRVLVADSAESAHEEPLLATEIRRRCDSIVLCAPRMPDEQLVALARTLRPMVLVNRPMSLTGVPSVSVDYRVGITQLAHHLRDLGHQHLVYVEGPRRSVSNAHRLEGLDEFLATGGGLRIDRVLGGVSLDDGAAAAAAVIGSGATAALAFNDLVAIGLVDALQRQGVRVPDDVSVTGFDDIPFARFASPALTTASVPHAELGTAAWARLHALVRGERPGRDVVVQPRLELRASSGPVRGRTRTGA